MRDPLSDVAALDPGYNPALTHRKKTSALALHLLAQLM
jgi:hypothetical protein